MRDIEANPATNRIYITDNAASAVHVMDGDSNAILASVPLPVGSEPFVIAVDPTANRIYVTHPSGNFVTVIDGSTNTVIETITVGSGPVGLALSPGNDRLYVANSGSGTVSVVNTQTSTVAGSGPAFVDRGAWRSTPTSTEPTWRSFPAVRSDSSTD